MQMTTVPTHSPTDPSTVFFGDSSGQSLCLPKAIPANIAAASPTKGMTMGRKI